MKAALHALERRIRQIEEAAGEMNKCTCPKGGAIYYENPIFEWQKSAEPSERCEACGGLRTILWIRYVENWRDLNS